MFGKESRQDELRRKLFGKDAPQLEQKQRPAPKKEQTAKPQAKAPAAGGPTKKR